MIMFGGICSPSVSWLVLPSILFRLHGSRGYNCFVPRWKQMLATVSASRPGHLFVIGNYSKKLIRASHATLMIPYGHDAWFWFDQINLTVVLRDNVKTCFCYCCFIPWCIATLTKSNNLFRTRANCYGNVDMCVCASRDRGSFKCCTTSYV